jgi:hypothetical protein
MRSVLPDEIQAFRDERPEVGEYPAEARDRAWARLTDMADEQVTGGRYRSPRRQGSRTVRLGLVGGVAAAVAVAVTLTVLPGQAPRHADSSPSSSPRPARSGHAGKPGGGASAAAAKVLTLAATKAARETSPAGPAAGQYTYIKQIYSQTGPSRRCFTWNAEEWMARDGAGRTYETYTQAGCGAPLTQHWQAGTMGQDTPPDNWPQNLNEWHGLPTNPAALEQAIVHRYDSGHTSDIFLLASDLLEFDAPPALRSALFQVLRQLPGVQYLGRATDRLGRHGVAVGQVSHGVRGELIFDLATTRALEYEEVVVSPQQSGFTHARPGTVVGYNVYVSTGVRNSDTQP